MHPAVADTRQEYQSGAQGGIILEIRRGLMAEAKLLHWSTIATPVSEKLPAPYNELMPDDQLAITELRKSGSSVVLALSHPVSEEKALFVVRWVCAEDDINIAVISYMDRTVDPEDLTYPDTVVRVLHRRIIALLNEDEFNWSMACLQDSVNAAKSLSGADWNKQLWTSILNAFGEPPLS